MHFSSHLPVSHFVHFTCSCHMCYSLNMTNCGMREKKIFFSIWLLHQIRYIKTRMLWDIKLPWSKELENRIFRRNRIFRHTCMYKQPILTKYHIFVQKLHSHFRYTDRLRYTDVFSCCSLQYYQSFMRNHEGKIELQKKVHKRKIICCLKLNMYIFF